MSFINPLAEWRGPLPAGNYAPGRDGHSPTPPGAWICLHTMVGSWQSAEARFESSGSQASATYGVCLDGHIIQWVDEDDAAFADGIYSGGVGANLDSISIEHEDGGDYNGPRTPALYAASAQLVADICRRRGIACVHADLSDPNGSGIVIHREVSQSPTSCPDSLDWQRIIADASAILNPPQEEDDMKLIQGNGKDGHGNPVQSSNVGVYLLRGSLCVHVPGPPDADHPFYPDLLQATGQSGPISVTQTTLDWLVAQTPTGGGNSQPFPTKVTMTGSLS